MTNPDRPVDEVLRDGARALLIQAVEAEVSGFLSATANLKTDDGCRRVVGHGHLPERQIMTGPQRCASRACPTGKRALNSDQLWASNFPQFHRADASPLGGSEGRGD